ncbi:hypothetical protein C8046_10330 [Serinibacter arcticus]|uniref:Gram-positive cocci surface proteins LPxTG domain-containing protein n=1 Tax=Serinibacter arcticus TaxID=1655435 RepID=A0A2U1ZVJ6_9MICO|nr:SdrD B-like domain-containing protein [Serinibacter arcticus]PWD50991.1 hypothetical protein C8046_10330 [Serinibacter arcticus]
MSAPRVRQPTTTSARRRVAAALTAAAAALIGSVAIAGPAAAADVSIAVSNATLRGSSDDVGELDPGEWLRFDADLATPPGSIVRAGDTFSVTLPAALRLVSAAPFTMTDTAGAAVATCVYQADTDPQNLVCTFTNAEPIQDWAGKIWFTAAVENQPGEVDLTFKVNDTVIVPFTGTIGTGPTGPSEPDDFDKGSGIHTSYEYISWGLSIPSSRTAELRGLATVTISDDLVNDDPEFKPHAIDPDSFRFVRYAVDAGGGFAWGTAQEVDPSLFTVGFRGPATAPTGFTISTTGSIFEAGYYYRVEYTTDPIGGVYIPGDKYKNDAEIAGNAVTSTSTVMAYGGGAGDGSRYVDFSITKQVTGEAVPDDTTFTVEVTAPGHDPRTLTVVNGGLAQSGYYPVGTTLTVSEVDLPAVPGITWGEVTVAGDGVVDNGDGTWSLTPAGGTTAVLTLTNVARAAVPAKVSVGDYVWFDTNRDGVQDAGERPIPGVTLTLTGPDGKPVTDVNGVLVPPTTTDAGGKYLFANLPVLAVGGYTVTVTPPAGYVATTPGTTTRDADSSTSSATSLSLPNDGDSDLTLDFGFVALEASPSPTATVTPTATATPSVAPTVTHPPTRPTLPTTGADGARLGLAVAGGLVLAGTGALLVRRRRVQD